MMQYLTAATEVNSWHTLLALFIVAFVLLAIFFFRTVFGTDKKEEAPAPAPRAPTPCASNKFTFRSRFNTLKY